MVAGLVLTTIASLAPAASGGRSTPPSLVLAHPAASSPAALSHPGAPLRAQAPSVEPSYPASWPTFLHDAGRTGANPNETTIATSNASSLTSLWTVTTKFVNTGSLILVNGTVYFGSWDGRLYAVNAYNGSVRWKTLLGGSSDYTGCGEPGVAGTPAYWNGTLYIGGSSPSLYAVNAGNGSVEWKLDLANATGSSGTWAATKIWSSPLVYNGSIYEGIASGCDNPLVRGMFFQIGLADHQIDHTFNVVPSGQVGGGIWASAAVDPRTNTVWITTGNEGVATQQYARALLALNGSNVSKLVGYWQEGSPSYDLDFGDGATLFHSSTGRPMVVAVNKDGWAYAFNESGVLKSGTGQPAWKLQLSSYAGEEICPPAFGGGQLYFGSVYTYLGGYYVNGTIQAVSPDTGSSVWIEPTHWPVYAGLVYANGVLVVGQFEPYASHGYLTVLDATNGNYLTNFSTFGGVYGEPIIAGGELLYASGNLSSSALGGKVEAFTIPLGGRVIATPVNGRSESTFQLVAHPSGGVAPFNVSWQFGDGATAFGATVVHSYAFAGVYLGKVTIRDGLNVSITRSFNLSAYAPLVASGSVSANPVNLGNATTLGISAAGAAPPYAYTWSGLPPGVSANGTTTAALRVDSPVEGVFNVSVAIGSPSGQAATVRFPPLWVDGPTQYAVAASPSIGIAPLMVHFSAASAYPNAPGSYAWQFGDGATSTARAPSHLYFGTGQFAVQLTVGYPGGTVGRGGATVSVYAPFSASLSPFAEVDRGMPFTLNASVSGGLGSYAFTWVGLPTPCHTANASTLTCQPTEIGSFPVALTVADPLGGSTVLYASVLVHPPLAVNAVVGTPAPFTCGGPSTTSVGLSATVSGGTPPYVVNWTGPGGAHYTGLDVQPTLPGPGNFSIVVNATDLVGGAAQQSVAVLVAAPPCASPSSNAGSSSGAIALAGGVAVVAAVLGAGSMWLRRRRRAAEAPPEPDETESSGSSEPR